MKSSLFSYVWQHSKREQMVVLALTLFSFPLLYLSLEIPKQIINDALSGDDSLRQLFGVALTPVQYLLLLSFALLALVVIGGLIKMRLNTYKGVLGERVVRRLRFELIERLLRFPLRRFQRVSQGEVIATVVSETEPLAGFASEAVALPLFQGGTLLTIMAFMFAQSWQLGLASLVLVPVQVLLIPRLQRRINLLRKQRIGRARALSQRLGETVDLVEEIRIQGTRRYTLAEFSYRLGELFRIRLELFERKFFMKFLNNTINQMTPFMFYAVGGMLVLDGKLSIGALVAAIAAHKDFISPWKELLNFYQTWQDSIIKYRQIVDQYVAAEPLALQTKVIDERVFSEQPLQINNVSCKTEGGDYALRGMNWKLPVGKTVAVVGEAILARRYFGRVIAGLDKPDSGSVCVGELPLEEIDEETLRQNVGYVDGSPKLFNAPMSYNLVYGLNHQAPSAESEHFESLLAESKASGNSVDWFDESFDSTWLNTSRIDAEGWDEFGEWMMRCLHAVDADKVINERAFFEVFDPATLPEGDMRTLGERLLVVREKMALWLENSEDQKWVVRFDEAALNPHATLGENFLFGTVVEDDFSFTNTDVQQALRWAMREEGLLEQTRDIARQALTTLLRLHQELPSNHPITLRFELHSPERLQRYKQIAAQLENDTVENLKDACKADLMALFLRIVPNDWPSLALNATFADKLVAVREKFAQWLSQHFGEHYHRFNSSKYNPGISVLDNVLYGRLDPHCDCHADLLHRAQAFAVEAGVMQDLQAQFILSTQAGLGGSRLPNIAHHRINLARTLLKKPSILIMHDALTNSSPEQQANIRRNIRELLPNISLLWVTSELTDASDFDHVFDLTEDQIVGRVQKSEAVSLALGHDLESEHVSSSLLQSIPLLSVLNPEQLELVALHSKLRKGMAGERVLGPEDRPSHAAVVLAGEASAIYQVNGKPFEADVENGEPFGDLEIISRQPRTSQLFAQTDINYLLIESRILNNLLDQNSALAQRMLRNVAKRVLTANLTEVSRQT